MAFFNRNGKIPASLIEGGTGVPASLATQDNEENWNITAETIGFQKTDASSLVFFGSFDISTNKWDLPTIGNINGAPYTDGSGGGVPTTLATLEETGWNLTVGSITDASKTVLLGFLDTSSQKWSLPSIEKINGVKYYPPTYTALQTHAYQIALNPEGSQSLPIVVDIPYEPEQGGVYDVIISGTYIKTAGDGNPSTEAIEITLNISDISSDDRKYIIFPIIAPINPTGTGIQNYCFNTKIICTGNPLATIGGSMNIGTSLGSYQIGISTFIACKVATV